MSNSPSPRSSPARKRQRLSSPTYESQLDHLTQEELAAFDAMEANILLENAVDNRKSQDSAGPSWAYSHMEASALTASKITSSDILRDDPDNPFNSGFSSAKKIAVPKLMEFAIAPTRFSAGNADQLPDEPSPEHDDDNWFNPMPVNMSAAFGRPSLTKSSATFAKASGSSIIKPSEAALAKARAKFAAWDKEDVIPSGEKVESGPSTDKQGVPLGFTNSSLVREPCSPQRRALASLPNVLNTPGTPTPAIVTTTLNGLPKTRVASLISRKSTAFKSPLQARLPAATHSNFPGPLLNPNRPATLAGFTTGPTNPHPLSSSLLAAAKSMANATSIVTTPLRSTHAPRTRPGKFHTPFKPNMRPGQPGRLALSQSGNPTIPQKSTDPLAMNSCAGPSTTSKMKFFDLNPPAGRSSLANSGLRPHRYIADDFESYGINIKVMNQITPETALYYVFHSPNTPASETSMSTVLGASEALGELQSRGCTLATKPWVDNHWCLILWKLAGMVAFDPASEGVPQRKRWSWSEVIRQLLYRYERELNAGTRPPLRKIANQDSPASSPMVLCISNIFWSPPDVTEDGLPLQPHPELEVTDGWYRLRAQVDLPMARAVQKGLIRVGRKIGVAGSRLSTERKEPTEILEAYNSTKLVFSGNSSHLMAWHWKLGFMRGPCISTLHKLTSDGGVIAALDFVITKVYPLAFLEFIEDDDGKKRREGPRNEEEELRIHEQWKRRREMEASKLREEYDKNYCLYEKYIDRLEVKAGKNDDTEEEPSDIESLFDKLEDSAAQVFAKVTPLEAVWLARRIRRHVELGRQSMTDEIERELQETCPPRDVRSFRVLAVQDACTLRRPANRTAQMTVWDVLLLTLDEGRDFACGQRYLAVNLMPTSQSAWMDYESGSEIYLSTRRDTRWTKLTTSI